LVFLWFETVTRRVFYRCNKISTSYCHLLLLFNDCLISIRCCTNRTIIPYFMVTLSSVASYYLYCSNYYLFFVVHWTWYQTSSFNATSRIYSSLFYCSFTYYMDCETNNSVSFWGQKLFFGGRECNGVRFKTGFSIIRSSYGFSDPLKLCFVRSLRLSLRIVFVSPFTFHPPEKQSI